MVKNSLRIPLTILVTLAWIALAKAALPVHPSGVDLDDVDLDGVFSCVRRGYSFKVSQQDQRGRTCWDTVTAMSCWGRCDSNEISDWRFPFKRSHHPVCQHDEIRVRSVRLRNCDPGVAEGTDTYQLVEAVSCKCQTCNSKLTACEGLLYRGQRSTQ